MHNEPSSLEAELRKAMSRVEAPVGFAGSVLCRIESELNSKAVQPDAFCNPTKSISFRHVLHLRALRFSPALAAALLLMLLPLSGYLYQQHRRAQAEAAAQQFSLAMRLTHAALLDAGQQIAEHAHARNPE